MRKPQDAVVGNVKRLRAEVRENKKVFARQIKQAFREIDQLRRELSKRV